MVNHFPGFHVMDEDTQQLNQLIKDGIPNWASSVFSGTCISR